MKRGAGGDLDSRKSEQETSVYTVQDEAKPVKM